MKESWRWFGPNDPVTINEIRQTGATDIVSALHHIPAGSIWPIADIQAHQALIEDFDAHLSPLQWSVVESIPVHEDIKLGKASMQPFIDAWIASMENLAKCGIKVICYNFIPVIDWTRTDLNFQLPSGANVLFNELPSPANGITLCKGIYSSRPDNDLPQMAQNVAAISSVSIRYLIIGFNRANI